MKQSARVLGFVCACALAHADHCDSSYEVTVAASDSCNEELHKNAQPLAGLYAEGIPEANPTAWTKKVPPPKEGGDEKVAKLEVDADTFTWKLTLDGYSCNSDPKTDDAAVQAATLMKAAKDAEVAAESETDADKKKEKQEKATAAKKKLQETCVPLPAKWSCQEGVDEKCVVSVVKVSGGMAWWMWLMIVAAVSVIVGLIVWCLMCRNGDEGAQNNHGQAVTGIELAAAGS